VRRGLAQQQVLPQEPQKAKQQERELPVVQERLVWAPLLRVQA
jgi:hypothetical protein